MKQLRRKLGCLATGLLLCLTACAPAGDQPVNTEVHEEENVATITLSTEIDELEEGLSAVRYQGDYGFDSFLEQGGAASDQEVVQYLAENLLSGLDLGDILGSIFGCSTLAVESPEGHALFGRNFDWQSCEALVVESHPESGYASLSTVNMDFITQNVGDGPVAAALNIHEIRTLAALYAPLDGMNEAGLAVSVNMIQDNAQIDQNTGKPGLTTTTAIRLLLDRAANVDEALALLAQYDLHGSLGMMVQFALADASGRSVTVEYVNNEMVVTETPVLTNFYLAPGEKQGIGTEQSHQRYDILLEALERSPQMDALQVRDALDSVSKDNFGEFESTEWSIVMDLTEGSATYYHREDYVHGYKFQLERSNDQ